MDQHLRRRAFHRRALRPHQVKFETRMGSRAGRTDRGRQAPSTLLTTVSTDVAGVLVARNFAPSGTTAIVDSDAAARPPTSEHNAATVFHGSVGEPRAGSVTLECVGSSRVATRSATAATYLPTAWHGTVGQKHVGQRAATPYFNADDFITVKAGLFAWPGRLEPNRRALAAEIHGLRANASVAFSDGACRLIEQLMLAFGQGREIHTVVPDFFLFDCMIRKLGLAHVRHRCPGDLRDAFAAAFGTGQAAPLALLSEPNNPTSLDCAVEARARYWKL